MIKLCFKRITLAVVGKINKRNRMILAKNREIICLEKDCEFLLHIFLPVTPLSPQERDEGIMETREHDL